MLKKTIFYVLDKLPFAKKIYQRYKFLKNGRSMFPPGHFYSPIVLADDIKKREFEIWPKNAHDGIIGIDLNAIEQCQLLEEFVNYYSDLPFTQVKNSKTRYYFDNIYFRHTDAIFLYSMIRHFKPTQIIEIGSGFSSAVMLDTNNLFFNNEIKLTFIEPYPQRLNSLRTKNDITSTTLITSNVQNVNVSEFEKLNSGDILFVDSTHVVKTGSDVNYILFEILPRLKSGVLIHFHDIFYPFEYPKEWVLKGFNWNEDYFLKSFLMYNNEFEITLFNHYIHLHYKDLLDEMPLCAKNQGGSLWIRRK